MDINANIQGTFSFAPPPFITIPITPFTVFGVLNIGPEINLRAQANMAIQIFGRIHAGTRFKMAEREYITQILGNGQNANDQVPDQPTDLNPSITNDFRADASMQGQIT